MRQIILEEQLRKKIMELKQKEKTLFVLKGIPVSCLDLVDGKMNLEALVNDKFGYFGNVIKTRNYMSYEEFLLLADFAVAQYKEVDILNNNFYIKQYPIEECFSKEVRRGLLLHFQESEKEENDDSFIGDIDEYISLFEGLKEQNGYLVGVYNEVPALTNHKIFHKNLFDVKNIMLPSVSEKKAGDDIFDLIEESDYIDFIRKLEDRPKRIYIKTSNYQGDISKLKNHIMLAAYYVKEYSQFFYIQEKNTEYKMEHRKEYSDILKRYWGYSSYRNIKIYDMEQLENGKKDVLEVSQENIISDIVKQVENCEKNGDFHDIFVTAPTGAGKSVMFQVPAIYLAEKHNLLTIVISPLIGLMKDQVDNLEVKNYKYAETINSDISPILKESILEKVRDGKCHILYLSPETLLSRSAVEQLIGDRTIGMIVVDEAHIVTTWGKQFRPDYWYLGDHIKKLRQNQVKSKNRSFVIATFTATAIYHGMEDMYTETISSLHMMNPMTYLGYIKRNDIEIVINKSEKDKNTHNEYELDKFVQIETALQRAIITNKKTLIYFPTVALIQRCYEYLRSRKKLKQVTVYYGSLKADEKEKSVVQFREKEKLVMLATKAFGMGIDINDIEIVYHFAPTGNVCDYVQEIGRVARREDLRGEAYYSYDTGDFKHINKLHGLSMIRSYQLVKVIQKILELYRQNLQNGMKNNFTKRRNAMLLDAENFSYIFDTPMSDDASNINKVKTALLLIQKDYEAKVGFSPIIIRPIPMFSYGFFEIEKNIQKKLLKKYPDVLEEIEPLKHICRVKLNTIWEKKYTEMSFPRFKFLLYTRDTELDLTVKTPMVAALCVTIIFAEDYQSIFENRWNDLQKIIAKKARSSEYMDLAEMVIELAEESGVSKYKAQAICQVVIASMDSYRRKFSNVTTPIVRERSLKNGITKYQFHIAVNNYFRWVERGFRKVISETKGNHLYLINDKTNSLKEYSVILGILETLGCLTFEMIGGANSQLYIYVNQVQALKNIVNDPKRYENRILTAVSVRHLISVKMLTYIFESGFCSEEIWNLLEDYFLGNVPEKVKRDCCKEKPGMRFEN